MTWVLSLLVSKPAAIVAWVLVASLGAASGWFYIQNNSLSLENAQLTAAVDRLEIANASVSEALRQQRNQTDAISMSLEGCLAAYDEYRVQKDKVRTVVKTLTVRAPEEVDDESSRRLVDTYNDLFGVGVQ